MNHTLKKDPGTAEPHQAIGSEDGHGMMVHNYPNNPQNWGLLKKVYVSSVGWSYTFVLLFGLTSYAGGVPLVMKEFDLTMVEAILPFSLFLFGVFFAPIMTPHLSEKFGRMPVYLVSLPLMELFIVGASQSKSYSALAVTRFFAGFFGGPSAVLIEGTFADVWSAQFTSTYYSVLTTGSYLGAATGIIAGANVVFHTGNWRWTQYVQLIVAVCVWVYGLPAIFLETHIRAIQRKIARRTGILHKLPPAPTGVTTIEMIMITVIEPLQSLVSDPLTIGMTLYLSVNFGVLFQWFISVPVVLHKLTGFNPRQLGLGFIAAIGGTLLAAISVILIDQVTARTARQNGMAIEHRMIPAMVGALLNIAAVFWVGWTATPDFDYHIPVVGTAVYVWGSAMTLIAFISYLFDAFPARGTLISLTAAACARIVSAGWVCLVILISITNIGGNWTYSIFGFIFIVFLPWPFVVYFFGPRLRAKSRLSRNGSDFPTSVTDESRKGDMDSGESKFM